MSSPFTPPKSVLGHDASDGDVAADYAARKEALRLQREEDKVFRKITWMSGFDESKTKRPSRCDLTIMCEVILWQHGTDDRCREDAPYGVKKLFLAACNAFRQHWDDDASKFQQTYEPHGWFWHFVADELYEGSISKPSGVTPRLLWQLVRFYMDGFQNLATSSTTSLTQIDPMFGVTIALVEWKSLTMPEKHGLEPLDTSDSHPAALLLLGSCQSSALGRADKSISTDATALIPSSHDSVKDEMPKFQLQQKRLLREQQELRDDYTAIAKRQRESIGEIGSTTTAVAAIYDTTQKIEQSMRDLLHEFAPALTAEMVGRLRGFLEVLHVMMMARNLGDRPLRWVQFLRTRASIAEEKGREGGGAILAHCMCQLADTIESNDIFCFTIFETKYHGKWSRLIRAQLTYGGLSRVKPLPRQLLDTQTRPQSHNSMEIDDDTARHFPAEDEARILADLTHVPGFDFTGEPRLAQRDLLAFGELLVAIGCGTSLASSITEALHKIVQRASLVLDKHPTWNRDLEYAFWRIVAKGLFDTDELQVAKPEDVKALLAFYSSGFRRASSSAKEYRTSHVALSASTAIATWLYITEHEDFKIIVVPRKVNKHERTPTRSRMTKKQLDELAQTLQAQLLESRAETQIARARVLELEQDRARVNQRLRDMVVRFNERIKRAATAKGRSQ
ncbi:hypothetical protein Micbo1qcDRAFT_227244 [Microdochium bolleyi]|uniref:Uncharacterized protein n=1 Tax=Microdochium bolleyi TaxID=196109 RepID=A0A136IYT0_9PEZI|nr:hypothetical protein Micbo1qcDRAFT_227244 [Microdochium bolleyi]